MRSALLFSLVAISCHAADENVPTLECTNPSSYRVSVRHIEGKGIGYTRGYTSVDLFATVPSTL